MASRILSLILFALLTVTTAGHTGQTASPDFNPPAELEIERTWTLIVQGNSVGVIRGTTRVEDIGGRPFIRQQFGGVVGVRPGVSLNTRETLWVGPNGMERFAARFQETGSTDVSTMKARLEDDILSFDLTMKEGDPVYTDSFIKDLDYHWSTAYIDLDRQDFKENQPFSKKILDIYALESREVNGVYLGVETVEQGGHTLECRKVKFDYGEVKGIMWLAKDEFGWFLVKEEAETHGQPFEMYLDEYTRKTASNAPAAPAKKSTDFRF